MGQSAQPGQYSGPSSMMGNSYPQMAKSMPMGGVQGFQYGTQPRAYEPAITPQPNYGGYQAPQLGGQIFNPALRPMQTASPMVMNDGGDGTGGNGDSPGGDTPPGGDGSTTPPPGTTTPPYVQASDITAATSRNITRPWLDPQFLQSYGNYGPQFPNQSTQIGAAMYSNIQPQAYTPPWAVQNLPSRLSGPGYLNGGSVGNYGAMFGNRWGNGPREIGNPYPGNGYSLQNMNVPPAELVDGPNYNPFLRNQNGNWPYGAPGGAGNPLPQQAAVMPQQGTMQKSQPFMPGNVADTGNIPQSSAVMPQPGMQARIPANQRFDPYAGGTVPADPNYGSPMGTQGKAMQTQSNAIPGYGPPESQGVPATLDPRSMGWLIGALGGGNFQGIPQDIPTQQNAYQQYYNSSYGNQYTGPGFERSRNYTPFNWDWRQGMPR